MSWEKVMTISVSTSSTRSGSLGLRTYPNGRVFFTVYREPSDGSNYEYWTESDPIYFDDYNNSLYEYRVNCITNNLGGNWPQSLPVMGSDARLGIKLYPKISTPSPPYTLQVDRQLKNTAPTITDTTVNSKTLYENDVLSIVGSAKDTNNGDVIFVKYQLNGGTVRAIATGISNGSTPLAYNKSLKYSNKRLYDGGTDVSGLLAEGSQHTITIWAEDNKGGKSVEINKIFYVVHNSPPRISGSDENLGDKNSGFSVTYSVNDIDSTDKLTVKEKINGVTIRTLTNAPRNELQTVTITDEMLYEYSLLATNTIEIEINDGQGSVVYRRYTFKRTNTAPKIAGTDLSLGEKTEGFDITFSATDQENDTMSAKIFINDKLVETYPSIVSAQEYIYTLSKLDFVQLDNKDEHKIRIEVQDHNNATSIRNYTFTRKVGRIFYSFEKETDAMATQVLISPTWSIAEGAVAQVLVCNNAYDEVPTWEDVTEQILLERHFNFINAEKTGATWGIGVQIIINKGTATELSYLAGFGGAYK